jgi:dTDP-glucose pyrophosphorylase
MTKDLEQYLLKKTTSIKDAVGTIEKTSGKIALIVDSNHQLLGTVTDGDVRRAIMNGHSLEEPATNIMNAEPFYSYRNAEQSALFSLMQTKRISNIPIVDEKKRVVNIINLVDFLAPDQKDNWVVIMAGGFGKRLMPLTENTPKPMLKIGGKPVIELLINTFITQGFHRFYISVNYLGDRIKDHFGDGSSRNIEIRYLEEEKPLGTAGSLSLIKTPPPEPFFVVNGDIITNIKFNSMLDFHEKSETTATMGVREHSIEIPYGVVDIEDCTVQEFKEKPSQRFFVNTGIYVVSPQALKHLPKAKAFTMPDVLEMLKKEEHKVTAYPVTEYWLDIGRMEDFSRAEDLVEKIIATG